MSKQWVMCISGIPDGMSHDPQIRWWRVDLGRDEADAVSRAIASRCINQGRLVRELETRLAARLEVPHAVVTSSGSAALYLALKACGVGEGDEVIVPAHTFIATAHAVLLCGARVRLVDVCPDRPLMDATALEASITDSTRAIVPVHLNGAACDMALIRATAEKHGLAVVEDAAQAFHSRNADGWLGTQSQAGAFSLSITKLLTAAAGGFVATRDRGIDEQMRRLRNHGALLTADNVFDYFGFDLKLTDLQAAVALQQLEKLEAHIKALKDVYTFYAEALSDLGYLRMLEVRMEAGELPLWAQVLCAQRDKVAARLAERGIESRPFHPCLASSPHLGCPGPFPSAEFFAAHGLTLPSGPNQSPEDLARVVEVLHDLGRELTEPLGPWEPGA